MCSLILLSIVGQELEVHLQLGTIGIRKDIFRNLNRQKYKNTKSMEKFREQTRARAARHRENHLPKWTSWNAAVTLQVTQGNALEEN